MKEGERLALQRQLGLGESDFWIGVFGYINQHKRVASVMAAVGRLLHEGYPVKLLAVGEVNDSRINLRDLADEHRVSHVLQHKGYVEADTLAKYMKAADIVANLRYPTMGESSASLFQAFAMGKPTVISDVEAFSEIPDSVAMKVKPGPDEVDQIFLIFKNLISSSGVRGALGENSRSFVARWATLSMVAETYLSSICGMQFAAPGDRMPLRKR
jgi:glycosyltransferase involved in cell wall biosynthesis